MTPVAGALTASLWLAAAGATAVAPAGAPRPAVHKISVEVHGPVAIVQVTRSLGDEGREAGERLLDLALPEHAALVDVELAQGTKWRAAEATEAGHARDVYVERLAARGLAPVREPFDDSTSYRIRVARGARDDGRAVVLRYRFSLVPETKDGRRHIRFPGSPERTPVAAEVTVVAPETSELEIAGTHPPRGTAAGHASTRAAWEISWVTRAARAPGNNVALAGSVAFAKGSPTETLAAVSVEARGVRALAPAPNVLLLIDRSRSVGLPGLSLERDLARKLLEALPPATRFDALFFDRGVARLFPGSRPATREAIAALDAEMVPDRLRNGTDLPEALRAAGALLRREASAFAPRTLLVVITDGALPEGPDGAGLDRALGAMPGMDVTVASWAVRAPDDEPPPAGAVQALRALGASRGGFCREVRGSELDEALPAALATLNQGGDVAAVRLHAGGTDRALADRLAPGEGRAGVLSLAGSGRGPVEIAGTTRGARVHAVLRAQGVDATWLRPHLGGGAPTRLLATDDAVALVEPVLRPAPAADAPVKGSLDRTVVRNTLSLAYTPRARACYLARSGATPALRDLEGRVRLSIDLARGEVGDVTVLSSTLKQPEIEACLRDGAFAIEVPRALRSDAPVTAVLNLVFRPRTPEKRSSADEAAVGEQIDLVIEELHRSETPPAAEPPALDRSMIPTR